MIDWLILAILLALWALADWYGHYTGELDE